VELLQLLTEKAENCFTGFACLKVTTRHFWDLLSAFVVRARPGLFTVLIVDGIKAVAVPTRVALLTHWVKDINTIEAPFHTTMAVDILAATLFD